MFLPTMWMLWMGIAERAMWDAVAPFFGRNEDKTPIIVKEGQSIV